MKSLLFRLLSPSLLLLLSTFFVYAQQPENTAPSDYRKVRGMVQNKQTLQPIPYTTLLVVYTSSTKTDTLRQVTDDAGRFELAVPPAQSYIFTSQGIGYKAIPQKYTAEQLAMKGLIRIQVEENAEQLNDVVVVAQKPIVRLGIDRIAYNVKDDPLSKNLNLQDMMRRVPLVTVDGQGNLQVKGSSDFTIFLNGKPSRFISSNPKEVLRSIPASSVQNIEVITNPGVEYDAQGASVIINIITQKGLDLQGIVGTVSASYLPFYGGAGNANVTAVIGKASITANYNGSAFNSGWKKQPYTIVNTETVTEQNIRRSIDSLIRVEYVMHNASVGVNYEFNARNLLSTSFSFMKRILGKNLHHNYAEVFAPSDTHNRLYTEMLFQNMPNTSTSYEVRADYQHNFSRKGHQITLSYLFNHSPGIERTESSTDLEVPGNSPVHYNYNYASFSKFDEHTGQIDYIQPIGELHKIVAGVKYIHRLGSTRTEVDGILGFPTSNNDMDYTQQVGAGYLKYTFSKEPFSFQSGVRYEIGQQHVKYGKEFDHTFNDVVPEVGVSYNSATGLQLKCNYNMRISRPSITQLSPAQSYFGSHVIHMGNSKLLNERIHSFSISLASYGQRLTLQTTLDANYSRNPIVQYSQTSAEDPTYIITSYKNIGYSRGAGFTMFSRYAPITWFNVMFNGGVRFDQFNGGKTIIPSTGKDYRLFNQGWSGQGSLILNFNLPKHWILYLVGGVFSQPPTLANAVMWGNYHSFTVNKSFLNNKLTVGASLTSVFTKYYRLKMHSFGPGFDMRLNIRTFAPQAAIAISYTFGGLKKQIQQVNTTIKNNDISKVKAESAGSTSSSTPK